jgi:hypothetical protein
VCNFQCLENKLEIKKYSHKIICANLHCALGAAAIFTSPAYSPDNYNVNYLY